jgi:hypothetical protein
MRMQKLLAAAATVFLTTAGAAYANTVTDTYTITESGFGTGSGYYDPSITDDLGMGSSHPLNLTGSSTNFFVASPSGSCGKESSCSGPNYTQSGTLDVTMDFTEYNSSNVIIGTGSLTETGTYTAKYSGTDLGCSGKSGSGQTDCIDWTGAATGVGGSVKLPVAIGSVLLDVTFYNAQDWAITPKISFTETSPVPLPATFPLFASGLGALGLLGWRRKRKAVAAP